MEEEEKKSSFKVEDRRRFSAEGELKPGFQKEEPAQAAAAAPPPFSPTPDTSGGSNSAELKGAARPTTPESPDGEMTFAAFLVGISTQTLVHLGEIPDPHGGPPEVNLGAAQQLIDIVGMLRDKTRGNLDKDEAALLDSILFELRMKFVERSHKA